MNWFLYDRDLRHEKVKQNKRRQVKRRYYFVFHNFVFQQHIHLLRKSRTFTIIQKSENFTWLAIDMNKKKRG